MPCIIAEVLQPLPRTAAVSTTEIPEGPLLKLQSEVHMLALPELRIGPILRERGLKLATAESCTGGLIGSRITDIPGSSEYFVGSIVSYAYEVKVSLLGVPRDTLNQYGAVSHETVLAMAHGARQRLNADIAISVSGIAGPGGATPGKPVGTTCIGLVTPDGQHARTFQFAGSRAENKSASATAALQMLLDYLEGSLKL